MVIVDRVTREANRPTHDPMQTEGRSVLKRFADLITGGEAQVYNSECTRFEELFLEEPFQVEAVFISAKIQAGKSPASCLTSLGQSPTIHDFLLMAGTVRGFINGLAAADVPPLSAQLVKPGAIAAVMIVSHDRDEAGTIFIASPQLTFLETISLIEDGWEECYANTHLRSVSNHESVQ